MKAFHILVAVAAIMAMADVAPAETPDFYHRSRPGVRTYQLYPYQVSLGSGSRYDPTWSYNASYFPETRNGDGSYYGLGYSGYGNNDGGMGGYWYW